MADDYHRVFVRIDGEEKPVMMSTTDLKIGLQSMWLSDMDKGWMLLEGRMPDLMTKAMKAGLGGGHGFACHRAEAGAGWRCAEFLILGLE